MGGYITQKRTQYEYGSRSYKLAAWANPISGQIPVRVSTQTTTSYRSGRRYSNNPFQQKEAVPQFTPKQSSFDTGHHFDTIRTTTSYSHRSHKLRSISGTTFYEGPLVLDKTYVPWLGDVPAWDKTQADVIGSQFIRLTKPTAPSAMLSTAIGELWADGRIASFIGSATLSNKLSAFQKAGSEYLNVAFGWIPFVSELTDVLNAVASSEKIIAQFVRDSGRQVRRRRSFEPIVEYQPQVTFSNRELVFPVAGLGSGLEPSAVKRRGTITCRQWVRIKYSFSAAYTYYLDEGGDFFSDLKRFEQLANRLLGTRITPEVLWELIPFSWLIDWMSSVGVYIANYSAFNGDELVLKYGYVMRQQEHWRQLSMPGTSYGVNPVGTVVETLSSVRKSRVQSTPYGFGLNPNSFTGAQWAILAALGMTKAPNKLANFN